MGKQQGKLQTKKEDKSPLNTVRAGAVQMLSTVEHPAGNIEKAIRFCDVAATRGTQILCFPECASTGFDWVHQHGTKRNIYTEPVPGPMVERFAAKARELDMYIIMGMVERPPRSKKLYNTAFVVGPEEGYIGKYRKIWAEKVFTPGTEAPVFDTRHGRIGVFICADMRSTEIARLLVLKGATILFQPTAYWGVKVSGAYYVRRELEGKHVSQRSRAIDNGVPLVVANVGRLDRVNDSRILMPNTQGPEQNLARARRKEQLLVADVPLDVSYNKATDAARARPWLFRELAQEMLRATRR